MGYRSDVRIATNRAGYERLAELADLHFDDLILDEDEDKDSVILGWDEVKWYYPETIKVEAALGTLCEEEHPYEFIRVGEESDDIETRESDSWRLSRHIETQTRIVIW